MNTAPNPLFGGIWVAMWLMLAGTLVRADTAPPSNPGGITCELSVIYDRPAVTLKVTPTDTIKGALDCLDRLQFQLTTQPDGAFKIENILLDSDLTLLFNGRNERTTSESPLQGATLEGTIAKKEGKAPEFFPSESSEAEPEEQADALESDRQKILTLASTATLLRTWFSQKNPAELTPDSAFTRSLLRLGTVRTEKSEARVHHAETDHSTAEISLSWKGEAFSQDGRWIPCSFQATGTAIRKASTIRVRLKGTFESQDQVEIQGQTLPMSVRGPLIVELDISLH